MKNKDYSIYKKTLDMQKAYTEASKIQEGFALTSLGCVSGPAKPYEGYISVQDILSKIDSMVSIFESAIQNKDEQSSITKIVEIINNLYDLAQLKLAEAKRQSTDYMNKTAGIQSPSIGASVMSEPDSASPVEPISGGSPRSSLSSIGSSLPQSAPETDDESGANVSKFAFRQPNIGASNDRFALKRPE